MSMDIKRNAATALLRGRKSESETLHRLVAGVRTGESQVLVLRGEAGVGKTALLTYLAAAASGCRIARSAGVESEMEVAFSGLHQLCAPFLDRLDRLPVPQRDALGTAFGLSAGPVPDRLLVGLAVLSLLADVAEDEPLLCLIDDAQWLDVISAQTLGFVARRLLAERIGFVFAVREPSDEQALAGLEELLVHGLSTADALELLTSTIVGPVDERLWDRLIAETRGNPLALLELSRGLTPAELAGGFGLPDAVPLSNRIEQRFIGQIKLLSSGTRRFLLAAAVEPVGDVSLLWRAAAQFGVEPDAAVAAAGPGLIDIGRRVRFRHPLVRSAAVRSASASDRREVHAVLANVTDPDLDPDRRAWHRAQAAVGPDEEVAAELERSANRAQARGGLAAGAAFLERSSELTPDPARRAERTLAAAQAHHHAGAPRHTRALLAAARTGPLNQLQLAHADLLGAQMAFAARRDNKPPSLLLAAARRLEPLDSALARDTYLDAFSAALIFGRLSHAMVEVATAARAAPPASTPPRASDLMLDGLALLVTEGYAAGAPLLKRALTTFRGQDTSTEEGLRWLWLAGRMAWTVWDYDTWQLLNRRLVALSREVGALNQLTVVLNANVFVDVIAGELAAAAAQVEEAQAVIEATSSNFAPYGALGLAAWQGRESEVAKLTKSIISEVVPRGEGIGVTVTRWANAVFCNSTGRYEEALVAAQEAVEYPQELGFSTWSLVELIEAAARSGMPELAAEALERLSETTAPSDTDWSLGTEARCRALLSEGAAAERLYREAIDRLGRTAVRGELARAHLLFGEWLRRANRRIDAREQLRTAYDLFTAMGAGRFAERARGELLATGETVRKRTVETLDDLTPQEAQI
ncbi:MAG TPA: ATP-binding protein, partial [Solirubrobacteraceae bacterium]